MQDERQKLAARMTPKAARLLLDLPLLRARRLEEFPADRIILSSCQGCLGSFKGQGRETLHLLELLFGKSRKQGWKNRIFVTLCPGIVLRSR